MTNSNSPAHIATTSTPLYRNKITMRSAGACLCAALVFNGFLFSSDMSSVQKSNFREYVCNNSFNSAQTLLYNNGSFSVFSTGSGGIALDDELKSSFESLVEISQLDYNWNDNGAFAFSKSLIERCKNLVQCLTYQPDIFPTANNSIQFEWDNSIGDYLEVELFENGTNHIAMRTYDGNWNEQQIEFTSIGDQVEKFFARTI